MQDPFVNLLRTIREQHDVSQRRLAKCMRILAATYRHIERGRRPLPDFRHGLVAWIKRWEDCVGCTREERQEILDQLSRQILTEFSVLLDDVRGLSGR